MSNQKNIIDELIINQNNLIINQNNLGKNTEEGLNNNNDNIIHVQNSLQAQITELQQQINDLKNENDDLKSNLQVTNDNVSSINDKVVTNSKYVNNNIPSTKVLEFDLNCTGEGMSTILQLNIGQPTNNSTEQGSYYFNIIVDTGSFTLAYNMNSLVTNPNHSSEIKFPLTTKDLVTFKNLCENVQKNNCDSSSTYQDLFNLITNKNKSILVNWLNSNILKPGQTNVNDTNLTTNVDCYGSGHWLGLKTTDSPESSTVATIFTNRSETVKLQSHVGNPSFSFCDKNMFNTNVPPTDIKNLQDPPQPPGMGIIGCGYNGAFTNIIQNAGYNCFALCIQLEKGEFSTYSNETVGKLYISYEPEDIVTDLSSLSKIKFYPTNDTNSSLYHLNVTSFEVSYKTGTYDLNLLPSEYPIVDSGTTCLYLPLSITPEKMVYDSKDTNGQQYFTLSLQFDNGATTINIKIYQYLVDRGCINLDANPSESIIGDVLWLSNNLVIFDIPNKNLYIGNK